MNAKHTPGPWSLETVPTSCGTCHKIGPFPSNGARPENYACVYADNIRAHDYGYSKTGDELLANARLIAAAPDLLAELQNIANAYTADWDDPDDFKAWAQSRARDAISKATGAAE